MAQGELQVLEVGSCPPTLFVLAAMQFTADLKLGHYMKIPPRPMFCCQVRASMSCVLMKIHPFCKVVATVIAGTVQLGVQSW